ncbi:hypothetical protein B5E82_11215 [Lachnoclostridium sp. An138]|nr:hypothetical protein B5E82_11215 [Lachnoclostridium sp. An138]
MFPGISLADTDTSGYRRGGCYASGYQDISMKQKIQMEDSRRHASAGDAAGCLLSVKISEKEEK